MSSKPREWWIDFRDNGDAEVVHDSEPTHVQGECVHVLEATPTVRAAEEMYWALQYAYEDALRNQDGPLSVEAVEKVRELLARIEREEKGAG